MKRYGVVFVPDDDFPTWNVVLLDDEAGTRVIAYHIKDEADARAMADGLTLYARLTAGAAQSRTD